MVKLTAGFDILCAIIAVMVHTMLWKFLTPEFESSTAHLFRLYLTVSSTEVVKSRLFRSWLFFARKPTWQLLSETLKASKVMEVRPFLRRVTVVVQ